MQTVGELLREEREKKGLSLKEIETAISIRTIYLNAIEEGNYDLVPGEVYLKGFIRNYANYLGLNGQEMVVFYRQAQTPPPPPVVIDSIPDKVEEMTEQPVKNNTKSSKWLVISLLVICVAGSAWWLLGVPQAAKEPQSSTQVQQQPVVPNPSQPIQSTLPASPGKSKNVIIIAKFTEKCWTSVAIDGKTAYEGTPQNGETITWEGQKNITITAGNAGGVDINLNGQPVGKLGEKGEVIVKTFPAPK